MEALKVPLKRLKTSENNPRFIRDENFAKLVKSLREFPEMLEKRPLVVVTDEAGGGYVVLGGNMRLRALREIGAETAPVVVADDWTEAQRREFLIKDNVSAGAWNWDEVGNEFELEELAEWGLDVPLNLDELPEKLDDAFVAEVERIKNADAAYPIVPEYAEKHNAFIILCENEIDEMFIREKLGLHGSFKSYKDQHVGRSNVVTVEMLRNL